jgi:hypothetical protein
MLVPSSATPLSQSLSRKYHVEGERWGEGVRGHKGEEQSRAMLEPPSATPLRQSVIRQYPPTAEATDESLSEDGCNLIATERKLAFSKSLRLLQTIAEPELPSSATASPLSTATSTCVEEDMGGFLPEATDSVTHPWVCENPYIEISVLPVFEPRGYTPVRKVVDRQYPVNAGLSAQHRESLSDIRQSLRENPADHEGSAGLASTDDPANTLTTAGMPSHVSEETRLSCVTLGQSDKKSPNIKTNVADNFQAIPSLRKSIPSSYYEHEPEGQGKENMHQLENRHIGQHGQ